MRSIPDDNPSANPGSNPTNDATTQPQEDEELLNENQLHLLHMEMSECIVK